MTKTSLNINEICNRYANALILSSQGESDLKVINSNFKDFNKLLEVSKDLSLCIQNPLVNSKKKSEVLKKICESSAYSEVFKGFLTVLTKHGKITLQNKIFNEFQKIIDTKSGLTEIFITTALPLENEIEEKIKDKLAKTLNLKVKLTKTVDKGIIGGIIIKINSMMIDNSIKSKLVSFKI